MDDLRRDLQRLDDLREIRATLTRYCRLDDSRQVRSLHSPAQLDAHSSAAQFARPASEFARRAAEPSEPDRLHYDGEKHD